MTGMATFDASRMLSFDLETTSANPREARVVTSALVRIDGSAELTMTELAGAWAATMPSHFAAASAPNAAV